MEQPREPWDMTPNQYDRYITNFLVREYGLTRAEVRSAYPPGSHRERWWQEVLEATARGAVLRPVVLDRLTDGEYLRIAHDYRSALPQSYMRPAIRKMNREYSAEMRRIRRGEGRTCA